MTTRQQQRQSLLLVTELNRLLNKTGITVFQVLDPTIVPRHLCGIGLVLRKYKDPQQNSAVTDVSIDDASSSNLSFSRGGYQTLRQQQKGQRPVTGSTPRITKQKIVSYLRTQISTQAIKLIIRYSQHDLQTMPQIVVLFQAIKSLFSVQHLHIVKVTDRALAGGKGCETISVVFVYPPDKAKRLLDALQQLNQQSTRRATQHVFQQWKSSAPPNTITHHHPQQIVPPPRPLPPSKQMLQSFLSGRDYRKRSPRSSGKDLIQF